METVKQAQKQLSKRRRRMQILYIVWAEIYAVALIFALLRKFVPAIIIVVVNTLFFLLYLRRETKICNEEVNRLSVRYGLCENLKEMQYTGREGMTAQEFIDLEMSPIWAGKGGFLVRCGFAGKGSGMTLKGWEITFPYPVWRPTGKKEYTFLSGTLLTAEDAPIPDPKGEWLFIRKKLLNAAAKEAFLEKAGYCPVESPLEDLNEDFEVYTKKEDAQLPPELAERFLRLEKKAACLGIVRLTKDKAAAFLPKRFFTVQMRLRDNPNEAWLRQNLLPERDGVWEFFRYWSRAGK